MAVQPVQIGEEAEECDVQKRRVVPVEAGRDDLARPRFGHEPGKGEQTLDQQSSRGHYHPEPCQEPERQAAAVVLPIDQQQRQGDEVSEEKADHAPEADAALPQRRRHRHVADRADKAHDRDERSDDHVLQRCPKAVAAQK